MRFNPKKLNELEIGDEYQIRISNRSAALGTSVGLGKISDECR
jgi:hypothetical protein